MQPVSPYAAPRADADAHRARALHGWLTLAAFAAALGLGGVLCVGALSPGNVLGLVIFLRVFVAHQVIALASVTLLLLLFLRGRRPRPWLRFGFEAGTLALALTPLVVRWTVPGFHAPGVRWYALPLVALALGVAGWSARDQSMAWTARCFLVAAAAAQAVFWTGALAGSARPDFSLALFPVVLAIVMQPLCRREDPPVGLVIAGLVYAASRLMAELLQSSIYAIPEAIAGAIVGVTAFRAATLATTSWSRWLRRAEAALFIEGGTLSAFVSSLSTEVHLYDTLFAIGAMHLEAFVLVFEGIRWLPGASRSRWGRSGLALAFAGAQLFAFALLHLGSRGNPRRYAAYLPQFTLGHRVAAAGALAMLAGLGILVVCELVDRQRRTSPS